MSGRRIPSYRLHKPSQQAVVTLSGHDHYLGPWQTPASKEKYDRLIAEWLANGRVAPGCEDELEPLTVSELLVAYLEFADTYYVKNGRPTAEQAHLKTVVRVLRRLYGSEAAEDFGPMKLKACRGEFVRGGQCRKTANQNTGRIKRIFRWAVENELVPPSLHHGLAAVASLKKNRSEARESPGVTEVPDEHVQAVLPHLPPPVAAMVQLLDLTGMRPGEIVQMRGQDIDRRAETWLYRPPEHKTEHLGKDRVIPLGPQCQLILQPFLEEAGEGSVFSPKRAEEARMKERRENRKTKMTPSQRKRRRAKRRKRDWGEHYDTTSLRVAVQRACRKAGIPKWRPLQLRHNAAGRFREKLGYDFAQAMLGHSHADTTQIYAGVKLSQAIEAAKKLG